MITQSNETYKSENSGFFRDPKSILVIFGIIIEVLFLLYRQIQTIPSQAVIKYMIIWPLVLICGAIAFKIVKLIQHKTNPAAFFYIIFCFSLLFGITLIATPPDQSDDIYRYIWDGKVQSAHINPYTYAPNDPALNSYHSEMLPSLVNFPALKSIYPPMAQVFFYFSHTLFGESITGMKFLFMLILMGSIIFFYLILRELGKEPRWLLFFAWNPLVIMETTINGHLDILMVFFLLGGLWFLYRKFYVLSGIFVGCAVMTKIIPLILLPVILLHLIKGALSKPGWKLKFSELGKQLFRLRDPLYRFFIPLLITLSGFYVLYFSSLRNMLDVVLNYTQKWFFNNPVFFLNLFVFKTNHATHLACFMLFFLVYLYIIFRDIPFEKKVAYVFTAFVVLNPTVHPWYLIILAGLLCLSENRIIVAWTGLIIVSYVIVYQYKTVGRWKDSWPLMLIEYLPLLFMVIYGYWRERGHVGRGFLTSISERL